MRELIPPPPPQLDTLNRLIIPNVYECKEESPNFGILYEKVSSGFVEEFSRYFSDEIGAKIIA